MEENADGPLGGGESPHLFLSAELGRHVQKHRREKGIPPEALLATLTGTDVPITIGELAQIEAGESIDWAEPGFTLIAALAFLFEVSPSEALLDSEPFATALAKGANLQRIYIESMAGIDKTMSETMLKSLGLPLVAGDLERMAAGEDVAWADPGLRLAAALARALDISLDEVVVTALSGHFGKLV